MNHIDITIWIEKRWYNALSSQLTDTTLEIELNRHVDHLCRQLLGPQYARIKQEIEAETQMAYAERLTKTNYAAFKVKENGQTYYFMVNKGLEFLPVARITRRYLCGECCVPIFKQLIYGAIDISADRFQELAKKRMNNTGHVTGAFILDFEQQHFSALHIFDGWQTFRMLDISNAVFHADRKKDNTDDTRWNIFLDYLVNKAIGPNSLEPPINH